MKEQDLHIELLADMKKKNIDIALTLDILNRYNAGQFDHYEKVIPSGVPPLDGIHVIDIRNRSPNNILFKYPKQESILNLEHNDIFLHSAFPAGNKNIFEIREMGREMLCFTENALEEIGKHLLPKTAYGVLNGGSATSYIDIKKNGSIDESLFEAVRLTFEDLAKEIENKPKGLTPAYINPDGSAGASFLELKMRSRLLIAKELGHDRLSRKPGALASSAYQKQPDFLPLFQMTSVGNHEELLRAYEEMRVSPYLSDLAHVVGLEPCEWVSGIQPLIAAYTHSTEGLPKRVFDRAYGKHNSSLAIPGGHGQSFMILADIYRTLLKQGIRYAMLSNVDNTGAYLDPIELAILAISGKPAGFDFAFRTPVDVKGGILILAPNGSRNVVDIGPAIGLEEVECLEKSGSAILFNCATGIFDLEWLVPHIEEISRALPIRFSDQSKDAGNYSQAEQVTWEVVSLLPDFIAFAVQKDRRFLAAKMLIEMLLASGFGIDKPSIDPSLKQLGMTMHNGQSWLLENVYGLTKVNGRWLPQESALCI